MLIDFPSQRTLSLEESSRRLKIRFPLVYIEMVEFMSARFRTPGEYGLYLPRDGITWTLREVPYERPYGDIMQVSLRVPASI